VKEEPSQQDARPMGGALWRYGTQEEGFTNHSCIHTQAVLKQCTHVGRVQHSSTKNKAGTYKNMSKAS
jgi:hypothetical protein